MTSTTSLSVGVGIVGLTSAYHILSQNPSCRVAIVEKVAFACPAEKLGVKILNQTIILEILDTSDFARAQGRWDGGWSGHYDVTPDWHPILDESETEGLCFAVGFSGHGFKLPPAVGKLMARFVVEGKKPQDLTTFSGSRFREGKQVTGQYVSNIIA